MVLLAVLRLEGGAYGMAVRDEIGARSGRRVSLGAVYATLDRLRAKGYLRVTTGPAEARRLGRPRKFFALEPAGKAALEASLETLRRMLSGIPRDRLERVLG